MIRRKTTKKPAKKPAKKSAKKPAIKWIGTLETERGFTSAHTLLTYSHQGDELNITAQNGFPVAHFIVADKSTADLIVTLIEEGRIRV